MKTPSSADLFRTHDTAAPVELTDAQLDQVTGGDGVVVSILPGHSVILNFSSLQTPEPFPAPLTTGDTPTQPGGGGGGGSGKVTVQDFHF